MMMDCNYKTYMLPLVIVIVSNSSTGLMHFRKKQLLLGEVGCSNTFKNICSGYGLPRYFLLPWEVEGLRQLSCPFSRAAASLPLPVACGAWLHFQLPLHETRSQSQAGGSWTAFPVEHTTVQCQLSANLGTEAMAVTMNMA